MFLKLAASTLRKNQTDAEMKLWQALRKKQFANTRFRRQVIIENYIVDFLCHESRLIIEVDGGQHQQQQMYDSKRTEILEKYGYKVLRFWNHEVLGNLDTVIEKIWLELRNLNPHPSPPPSKREGIRT